MRGKSIFIFCLFEASLFSYVIVFGSILSIQLVAFENSRVAAPTFWKRVGGFHENCLRLA
jgi:hypothetical protein